MTSPAARYRAMAEAKPSAIAAVPELSSRGYKLRNRGKVNQASGLMAVRLHDDLRKLSTIRSKKARNELKRELIPCYIDHLTGAMMNARLAKESGDNYSLGQANLVLSTVCIWCFDTAEYSCGLTLFEFAIEMQIRSPDNFKSSMVEIICRTLAEKIIKHSKGSSEHRGVVETVLNLTDGLDMADQVRANLYRAFALLNQVQSPEMALEYYNKALVMNPSLRVKRVINRLEKGVCDE